MTRTAHLDDCPFTSAPLVPCVTCYAIERALGRAESIWNECSAMTERLAFERGRDLAVKAITDEAIRLGIDAMTAARLIGAGKGAQ